MRSKRTQNGLTVQAIAGTYVVLLGWNLEGAAARRNLLGFAIQRTDKAVDETYWLRGMKTFDLPDLDRGYGSTFSSFEHPFQGFQWADYSVHPGREYTFRIVPMYGRPGELRAGDATTVTITTESEQGETHTVYFNRGVVASQEYARRFQNKKPSVVGADAYRWLSRGLVEALLEFIGRAKNNTFSLHGAFYEFQWSSVLEALKAAADNGADVNIVYDAIGNAQSNHDAIIAARLGRFCRPITNGKIMHNKFLVLSKNGRPQAVWTGSTNITENGIFGHSNCGHLVEDREIAERYLAYWTELRGDPPLAELRDWTTEQSPFDSSDMSANQVFSPRRGLDALEAYAEIAAGAEKALFMTFAFGMHKDFLSVYQRNDSVLRFALMEKEGTGSNLAKARQDIDRVRRRPNVIVAIGHHITVNSFDRWLKERRSVVGSTHVNWIHTKYMLVDPLGNDPMVVTGSANFSKASTDTNHENMLVIRGNTRVADIYLGEFMRLYSHHAFRESVARHQAQTGTTEDWRPQFLAPNDSWVAPYFRADSALDLRRRYFAGI